MQSRFLIWKNTRQAVLSLTIILMVIGCINVFSASFVSAKDMFNSNYFYLFRYTIFGCMGLVVLWAMGWYFSYRTWFSLGRILFLGALALLILVDIHGHAIKGAQRWLSLGFFSFQPSEAAKLMVVIFGAGRLGWFLRHGERPTLLEPSWENGFVWTLILSALVLVQPDMGTAAIIISIMVVLYLLAGLHPIEVICLGLLGCTGVVAGVLMAPYRLQRFQIWWNPWSDPQGAGYQMVQSFVSIGSGGIKGSALGMGSGKFFFLPEAHTDFAFAIWCQEWGFLGALVLLLLFLLLGMALYSIAKHTKDERAYLLVMGINFLVVGQAIANMAMVCGIFPVIGVPLSFISYGGTSLLVNLAAIGIAINVYNDEAGLIIPPSNSPRSRERQKVLPFKQRGPSWR